MAGIEVLYMIIADYRLTISLIHNSDESGFRYLQTSCKSAILENFFVKIKLLN